MNLNQSGCCIFFLFLLQVSLNSNAEELNRVKKLQQLQSQPVVSQPSKLAEPVKKTGLKELKDTNESSLALFNRQITLPALEMHMLQPQGNSSGAGNAGQNYQPIQKTDHVQVKKDQVTPRCQQNEHIDAAGNCIPNS